MPGCRCRPTLALIADEAEAADFDYASLPDAFAIKPNRGRRGRRGDPGRWPVCQKRRGRVAQAQWRGADRAMLRAHVTRILAGELSLEGGNSDAALIEPLIRTHPDFAQAGALWPPRYPHHLSGRCAADGDDPPADL
jgi:hypothetical protein